MEALFPPPKKKFIKQCKNQAELLNPKNIENCSNHISKGSRSKFARWPDICFYIVNTVENQDLEMTKIWIKLIKDQRDYIDF